MRILSPEILSLSPEILSPEIPWSYDTFVETMSKPKLEEFAIA